MQPSPSQPRNPRNNSPVVMRSKLMLEAAAELVGSEHWDDRQVEINFRPQGAPSWKLRFFASDAPNSIEEVASGRAAIAICNPGAVLSMALHGKGPFKEPVPVRAIFVLPQFVQDCAENQEHVRVVGSQLHGALAAYLGLRQSSRHSQRLS